MRRRDFNKLIAGSAVAWPLAARAQRSATPVVGVLGSVAPERAANIVAGFRAGLSETGFVEGRDVTLEFRWAGDHYDRLATLSADLVAHQVAVIAVLGGTPAALAAKAATTKIPIIFLTGGDPVQLGLVTSFSRPEGNLTGVAMLSNTLAPKQLELLNELLPAATLVAFLVNPQNPLAETDTRSVKSAAGATGQSILVVNASNESELDTAFATLSTQHAGSVLVQSDPVFNVHTDKIVALAARYAVPALYQWREFPAAGGLMSYGSSISNAGRQMGLYAGKILKGAKPADLPVVQAVKVELVLNSKTAKALGISFPVVLLGRADEVIE